jgi:hypothetical protein
MHGTLKRLAVVAPAVVLMLAIGAQPAYADQTVIDSVDASPNTATAGDSVTFTDTVTLSGTTAPTGAVTFRMYPSDDCTGTPVFDGSATLVANGGTATSTATFTSAPWVAVEGEYHWWISYDGAGGQDPVDDDCDETPQRVVVSPALSKATPTLTGEADPQEVTAGEEVTLTDTATLNGASSPTGEILFFLYDNDECDDAGLVGEGEAPIVGSSATFEVTVTPEDPGTYFWSVFYEGDALNEEADGACDDPKQRLVVEPSSVIIDPVDPPVLGPDDTCTEPDPQSSEPPVCPASGGVDPTVAENGGEFLPVTGPAPVSRLAQGALAVLMIGLAAILMGTAPRTRW